MSKVRDRDSRTIVQRRARRVHRTVAPAVKAQPAIIVKTRFIEKPAVRRSIWPAMAIQGSIFGAIACCSFFASSLVGQVMVEKGRKELSETRSRTLEAKKAEAMIRDRVNVLTRADKIEEWAISNGMTPIDGLGRTASISSYGTAH